MTIDSLPSGAAYAGNHEGAAAYQAGTRQSAVGASYASGKEDASVRRAKAGQPMDGTPSMPQRADSGNRQMEGAGRTEKGRFDRNECQTCKRRQYQDGSDDPGVSFKTPTAISADNAANAVMGHEQEHVTRNAQKARREGREVISSSVTLQNAICPECGKVYVAGGETRTVTAERKKDGEQDNADSSRFSVGMPQSGEEDGARLNAVA